jgi:hypothetical protein
MKRVRLYVLFLAIICLAFPAFADNSTSKDFLNFYNAQLFTIGYTTFGGPQLNYQSQSSSLRFGIPETFKTALDRYPDTKALEESYHSLDLTGNVLVFGGAGIALVGAFLPLFDTNYVNYGIVSNTEYVGIGLFFGGLVMDIIGAILLPASYEKLMNGVNLYNRHEIENYTPPQ